MRKIGHFLKWWWFWLDLRRGELCDDLSCICRKCKKEGCECAAKWTPL